MTTPDDAETKQFSEAGMLPNVFDLATTTIP